jgi:tape measure domain-containing protein
MSFSLGELYYDLKVKTGDLNKAEKKVERSTSTMRSAFKTLAGAMAVAFSVQQVAKITVMADELRVAEKRIENLSNSTFEANRNLSSLKSTANETGMEFKSIFKIFEGFKRVQSDINATDDEMLTFTDSLAKLGKIGGSSQEEVNNALRQLNQSLSGGIVRAEEFNSVLENTPEIAVAIADGLHMSLGEMRELMLEGELLSEDVFEAILSQADKTNERFEKIPKTLGQVAQETKNILIDMIGELNKTTRFTEAISAAWDKTNEKLQEFLDNSKKIGDLTESEAERRKKSVREELVLLQKRLMHYVDQDRLMKEAGKSEEQRVPVLAGIKKINDEIIKKNEELAALEGQSLTIEQKKQEELKKDNEEREKTLELIKKEKEERDKANVPANVSEPDVLLEDQLSWPLPPSPQAPEGPEEPDLASFMEDAFDRIKALDFEGVFNLIKDLPSGVAQEWLSSTDELVNVWGNTFSSIAQVGKNVREKELQEQIDAVNARTDLSEEEKEETIKILKEKSKEKSKLEKAALIAERIAALASIAINTAKNAMEAGGLTPLGIAQLAFGAAQAAAVASTPLGGGRQFGGEIAPGVLTPVNENGEPEMLAIGNKQYLLTGNKGGRVTSGADMATNGGFKLTVINNANGVDVTPQYITKEEAVILINKSTNVAVNRINSSIESNQGSTARALNSRSMRV